MGNGLHFAGRSEAFERLTEVEPGTPMWRPTSKRPKSGERCARIAVIAEIAVIGKPQVVAVVSTQRELPRLPKSDN